MASFPTSVKTFTTKNDGDTIAASIVNDIQDEVAAVETWLLDQGWIAWTPTWTNLSVGNGTVTAAYFAIGDLIFFKISLVFGSTTAISGAVSVDFPVNSAVTPSVSVGRGEAIDSGTAAYMINARFVAADQMALSADNGTTLVAINTTVPFTWTTSDELHIQGFFEAA